MDVIFPSLLCVSGVPETTEGKTKTFSFLLKNEVSELLVQH